MTFTPITWTDGTTPVDASNLNRLESALSDAADSINSVESILTGIGTAISSGDDLNDYQTPGKYYSSSSAITGSLQNRPSIGSTAACAMFVFSAGAASRIIQLFFSAFNGGAMCFRAYYNEWTDWVQIV